MHIQDSNAYGSVTQLSLLSFTEYSLSSKHRYMVRPWLIFTDDKNNDRNKQDMGNKAANANVSSV